MSALHNDPSSDKLQHLDAPATIPTRLCSPRSESPPAALTSGSFSATSMWMRISCSSAHYNRLMHEATQAAPNPLSIFTTATFDAQLFSMPNNAATPPKLAP